MPGIKHLIECHCSLKIFKKNEKIRYHKFPVYSKIDSDGKLIPKLSKCNNCDSLHYIHDYCQSELRGGKDQTEVTLSIDDVSLCIPDRLSRILLKTKCDISTWEHCLDIIEEKRWGEIIVLRRDVIDDNENIKTLIINSEDSYKIENKIINTTIILSEK